MLLYGNIASNKTDILIEKYSDLLNKGINSDEILVILQNSKLKEEFLSKVKKNLKINALTKFNVYSFFGLCYNFVEEYYPLIENKIKSPLDTVAPNTTGLEASQYIFKNTINKIQFRGYNSKTNLLHQLLRRYSLITLNNLSEDEIKEKTKILKESFTSEINLAINMYKQKTLELRAFDYLRQIGLFNYIYKNVKNRFKYVFIDDADEITPVLFDYLKYIKNDVKEFFIAYDTKGTSRMGHLCASENNFELFLNETPIILDKKNDKNETADLIFENIRNQKPQELNEIKEFDFVRADEMIENIVNKINFLIDKGNDPGEILAVIPENDPYLKLYLSKINAKINFITGSEKLEENKTVSALISILKLINEPSGFKISPYKLRGILGQILKVSLDDTIKIVQDYEANFGLNDIFEILSKYDTGKISDFLNIKNKINNLRLSEQLYALADAFIEKTGGNKTDIQKINQLLKQIRDFENIFKDDFEKTDLIIQLENTIISENPLENNLIKENAVNISTIQKAIDFKIKNKYLFLIDTTNSGWMRQDIGPLYNAWIFQKNWTKKEYTLEDNIFLSHNKIARQLRKLYLLNEGEIYSYSSLYNFLGMENFKGIKHFFFKKQKNNKPEFKITPRKDQKPVLEYNEGRFAVTAVAGAGKTTIMLALIMKLLEENVKAENIFVLTYMDSAVRTFRERIKNCYPDLAELPNISTIHGLAMRILRENNNHAHLGLDVDFDIIDEIKRLKLITEIIYNEGIDTSKSNIYERAISAFKNSANKNESRLMPSFKRIYLEYQKNLKALNLIDYDDLLILALELLKQNSKIREYYQNLAHFVMEDEAQDSSAIQQELINIISKKYSNLIRCGDVNQAITSTFTNSDTAGFKKFINNNPSCTMNHSARNATGIISLANKAVKNGLILSKSSFLDIETMPVEGKNIIDYNAVCKEIFEKEEDEKNFILSKINEIFQNDKTANIGILLRTNFLSEKWTEFLKQNSTHKIMTKTDSLSTNPVFRAVLAVFNFINAPMNNSYVTEFAKTLMESGFYKDESNIFDYIKNLNSPFILNNGEDYAIWWDLRYFLELTVLSPYELAFRTAEFYFINDKKNKANIAPVSSIIAKISDSEGNFEDTLNKMNEIYKKPFSFNIKFFEPDEKDSKKSNEIYVLTMHKSKGDEFDYVFIPELTEKNMTLDINEIKLKEGYKIINSVQNSNKTEDELKKEILDENLRLFYVAITRAKKKLYLTCSKEYKIYNKLTNTDPSNCFKLTE